MKIKYTIGVVIGSIYVSKLKGETKGFYNFDWWIYENGKLKDYGNYDNSFTNGKTTNAWRKQLQRGEARNIILSYFY